MLIKMKELLEKLFLKHLKYTIPAARFKTRDSRCHLWRDILDFKSAFSEIF